MTDPLRVLLAHDYLTQRGGAERVLLALAGAFPGAPVLTSVYEPETTFPEVAALDVRTSWLQHLPAVRHDPRVGLALMATAWRRSGTRWGQDVDAVVCSSAGWSHGLVTDAPQVVYCHNPARWLYQREEYLRHHGVGVGAALTVMAPALRRWDRRHSAWATTYVANSRVVAERIALRYHRESTVVHPPRGLEPDGPATPPAGLADLEPGFLLAIGRSRGYKNPDVVAQAVAGMPGERLVQVGGLPPGDWPDRLIGVSGISDAELRWLYRNAGLLVAMSHEDFGLTPVEAFACGLPVAALDAGGYQETVVDGLSGVLVPTPTAPALQDAVRRARALDWDAGLIREHGQTWAPATFARRMQEIVAQAVADGPMRQSRSARPGPVLPSGRPRRRASRWPSRGTSGSDPAGRLPAGDRPSRPATVRAVPAADRPSRAGRRPSEPAGDRPSGAGRAVLAGPC